MHTAVIQTQAKGTNQLEKARGTLLASVRSEGMPENCEVICASYYDENAEKPFHMMTNVVEGIDVIEIKRKCFNTATMKHFWVTIKRLSLADLYNKNMNSVDLADQLRNHYRPDGLWLRNRKWWWSVMLWCLGQAMTNAFVMYKRVCKLEGATPMTHLKFQEQVATLWCMSPMIVLNESQASAATIHTTPGQRAQSQAQGSLSGASSGASSGVSSGDKESKERGGYLTKERLAELAESYKLNPALHKLDDVKSYKREYDSDLVTLTQWTPKCQICNKGLCMHAMEKGTVAKRCQKSASMCCTGCNVLVCSPFCWKALHGYAA